MTYDVIKVLEHYSIEHEEVMGDPDELYFLCPFHSDTSFGSARFNVEEGIWRCFSCPDGGNIFTFVSKLENCNTWEAEKLINSDFIPLNNFNIDGLKNKLGNFYESKVNNKYKKRAVTRKCIENMVKALGDTQLDLYFLSKWYPIIIYYYSYNGVEDKAYTREILDTYSMFFQELKSKEP